MPKTWLKRCSSKDQDREKLTLGLGAGMNPQIGKMAARESSQEVGQVLQGADMIF